MKLYRAKVPVIAKEIIAKLSEDGDIEVSFENTEEAEKDVIAIMEEYLRRESALRHRIRDYMDEKRLPYNAYGRVRKAMAEDWRHPLGDDIERFLARQFVECLMISRFVEEVYAEDAAMYRRILALLRTHHVDEQAIRDEAASKVKNVQEGTVDYEIALQRAVRDVKKRRGLL